MDQAGEAFGGHTHAETGARLAHHLETGGRLLAFGGPYSNLQSVLALRDTASRLGVPADAVICTGDIVAYCGEPNETCAAIRDWGCLAIAGNCEEQLAIRSSTCGCGFTDGSTCDALSRGWYQFADQALDDDHRRWMSGLPRTIGFSALGLRWAVIHGGYRQTSQFVFPSTPAAVKAEDMVAAEADVIIAGHAGIPFLEPIGPRGLWINAGVIGMPANDGTREGWYAMIEHTREGLAVATHRLGFDWQTAAARAERSAPAYAQALRCGLWPSLDVLPEAEKSAAGLARSTERIVLPHR
ncbi:MAG: metallophosphoesterase family protein [Hyphomicrobiaceae bacterium]|nr:metallophosphoesterase family protein [Hyphomicrobiaceae bacterium]